MKVKYYAETIWVIPATVLTTSTDIIACHIPLA